MKNLILVLVLLISFSAFSQGSFVEQKENVIFKNVTVGQEFVQVIKGSDTLYVWKFKNWYYGNYSTVMEKITFNSLDELSEFIETCEYVIDNKKIGNAYGYHMSASKNKTVTIKGSYSKMYVYKKHIKVIREKLLK